MPDQPEVRAVLTPIISDDGELLGEMTHFEHDGWCEFVDHQCSCGRLEVGTPLIPDDWPDPDAFWIW